MKRILKDLQKVDSKLSMDDIASNTLHLRIEWEEIADGTDHDPEETEMKIAFKWRESQVSRLNNRKKGPETRTKMLMTNQNAIIGQQGLRIHAEITGSGATKECYHRSK
jgi:hypothetical protein